MSKKNPKQPSARPVKPSPPASSPPAKPRPVSQAPAVPKPLVPPAKHEKSVAAAVADIGQREDPMGSNTGGYVLTCQRATWLTGTRFPWCRGATLKWRVQGGDKPGDRSAGAWDALERARKRDEVLDRGDWGRAIPGDEVIWNVGSGHSSLLERVDTSVTAGVMIHTIDGNSGDQVKRCTRPLSQVRGFIAWPDAPGLGGQSRKPRVQVVGGESGRRKLVVGRVALPMRDKVT